MENKFNDIFWIIMIIVCVFGVILNIVTHNYIASCWAFCTLVWVAIALENDNNNIE